MEIFRVIASPEGEDGYALSIEVMDGIPEDVFRKVAKDVSTHLDSLPFPEGDETVTKVI
jgi:hypothetical protein